MTALDVDTLALLEESLTRYRENDYAFAQRRACLAEEPGYSRRAWRDYAAFGWLAIPLPGAVGGLEGDPRAVGALMQYAGAALALEPLLASSVLCGRLLARVGEEALLRDIAAGERIYAFAHIESPERGAFGSIEATWDAGRITGTKHVVLAGDIADTLIVTARDAGGTLHVGLVAADAPVATVQRYRLIDGRGAATITFAQAPAREVAVSAADVEAVLDEARLALVFETLGAVRTLNAQTIEHLKTRKQFGRPLAVNQALQHRAVELFMLAEELRATAEAACRAPDARTISAACAHAAASARHCAHEAVQMHGGMGITDALPVSHYFKRLMVCARLLGDRDQHLRRFAAGDSPGHAPSSS